ncbi:MAG TPA: polymer-forming cytoskeletal protein [Candidatus Acidoferrales bacterium]|nr:polymer-forming cytoskeletal protein [Candidatus Acidoferrales bacterium]
MWRKQSEGKPSPSATPGAPPAFAPPSYAPPAPKSTGASSSPSSAAPFVPPAPVPSPEAAVLTQGIRIRGELTGKADLFIDGDVEGGIRLGDSRLTVGPSGHVKADIEAREIYIRGNVQGNLRGRERITLGNSCHMKGDLESPRIAIEDGAQFKGRVEMGPAADARERQIKRTAPGATPADTSSSDSVATSVPIEAQRGSR